MIIECINCQKKFSVDSELIPSEGRTIQCGSCEHIWFFKKAQSKSNIEKTNIQGAKTELIKKTSLSKEKTKKTILKPQKTSGIKGSEIVKYNPESNVSFGNFLSYLLVLVISIIALILILDTFKTPLYKFFPRLEFFLFSLFETLKDIQLFIKDLI